jgi:parallel beta-helix repeat protein
MKKHGTYFLILLPILLLMAGSALADPKKAGPNHSAPKNVTECGTILTEPGNYKLANDLLDCPEHGILIEGSDITLNFMGHEISCPDGAIGVFLMGTEETTVKNITVKNGHVSNCGGGIALWFAEDSKVMNMTLTGIWFYAGIAVWESSNNVIMHNYVHGNAYDGILSWQSSGNLFKHNTSTANGDGWIGAGIALDGETDSRIMCNRIHGNVDGIQVQEGSSGNLLRGNLVSGNQYSGIGMMGSYWKDPDPPYEEYYYAMPSGNTIRSNIVGDNPWADLWEAYWDFGDNVLPNPDGICRNTWEKNQFDTELGPVGCFGIPVELDEKDVCALHDDHDD